MSQSLYHVMNAAITIIYLDTVKAKIASKLNIKVRVYSRLLQ